MIQLPDRVSNPLSFLGMAIATAMAIAFLALALLELGGVLTNPYIGLLIFVTIPVVFVAGLILIPIGSWRSARHRRLNPGASEWPVIDLRQPQQRTVLASVLALTLVNIVIVSLGAYGGVHYMESTSFCGQVCHTTMEPEFVAHQAWPHARVSCTTCHIGPGAGAFVDAKLAGTRQLFQLMTNRVPKPVPPPSDLIQTARQTCEGCHWPETFRGDMVRVVRDYANDEASTESTTTLRLHVGGGSARLGVGTGIHWHMNLDNRIEFVATDESQGTIPYVRLTSRDGAVREYFAAGVTAAQVADTPMRRMDCMDCHNRPSHTFSYTAERAIDRAIAQGRIPRELPFVRREAVAAVSEQYATRDIALNAIGARFTRFYASHDHVDAALVERASAATHEVWATNVFPAMNVRWGTYPNHLGHVDTPGCFRCHDDDHRTADGKVIAQDCELCHTAPE